MQKSPRLTSVANTCFSLLSCSRRFISLFVMNSSSCSTSLACSRSNKLLAYADSRRCLQTQEDVTDKRTRMLLD